MLLRDKENSVLKESNRERNIYRKGLQIARNADPLQAVLKINIQNEDYG